MNQTHDEDADDTLTVLTVTQDGASIRGFHFDCRGETRCRPQLRELLQLLERRRADVAVFLAHPELVGSLVEQLRRRGKHVPEILIAPATSGPQPRLTVSMPLSGLSDAAQPQELLARLYEALRAAQEGAPAGAAAPDAPLGAEPPAALESPAAAPAAAAEEQPGANGGAGQADSAGAPAAAELEQLRTRLERIVEQRLRRQSQR